MTTPKIEDLLDAIVLRSSLKIVITEALTGLIVFANEAYIKAQGAEHESDVIGKTKADLHLWKSPEEREEWRKRVFREGEATRRFNFVQADGQPGAHSLFTQLVQLPQGDYFVSYDVDISEIVAGEQLALERLNRAQRIARFADIRFDVATGLITGSSQMGRIMNIDPDQGIPIERMLMDHTHPDDLEYVREVIDGDPSEFKFNFRYIRSPGDVIWIELIGSAIRDVDGKMTAWEGTVQDITDRKNAELEQVDLNEKMREAQKLESLGVLAGGVAHDFNNLLVGILGNADLALLDEDLPQAAKDRLKDIVTTSQRAAELTNQLLAYSGKGRFVITQTDLSALVREMSELLNLSVTHRSKLQLFLAPDLPLVEVDQTQLRQVVMNLIMNASEAIEHGNGVISVTTGTETATREYLETAAVQEQIAPGEYVYVEVSDNGHGIPPDVREKLFEPFFTTKFSGRGLGMSAVMGIVRGHKGGIQIYTEQGRGTKFKVLLPASNGVAPTPGPSTTIKPIATDNQTVLVIDDDQLVLDLLARALEAIGFAVIAKLDGKDGFETFRKDPDSIALVLVDLTMPGQDGVTTFNQMRRIKPSLKAILMSGYNEQDATQLLVGKGLAGFLHKPFRMSDLSRVISEVLA